MRALVAARLSRLGDASTGIDKQDEASKRYAAIHGHEIIATAADTDVSGSTSPFDRPELGPWLTDPERLGLYDEIVASALDRLGRSARYMSRLRDWCEDHGKRLTVLSPPLHWPPDPDDLASPIIWDVLGRLAEYELTMTTKRSRETREMLIRNGFLVGRPPFGYRIIEKGEHKTLEPDPALVPVIREMVSRYTRGYSLVSLCEWLADLGVPPPNGGDWIPSSVRRILRNSSLRGRRQDAAGRTILRFPGVMTDNEWNKLQQALDSRVRRKVGPAGDTAMLTNIAVCGLCGGPMYRHVGSRRVDGTAPLYYRCHGTDREPSRCRLMIRLEKLDAWVDEWFTTEPWGDHEVIERVTIPGTGHEAELDANAADVADLLASVDDLHADTLSERLRGLKTERQRIQEMPAEPDRVLSKPTGVMLWDLWPTLDTATKRRYLLSAGVKIHGTRDRFWLSGDPYAVVTAATGADFGDRLLV